MKTTRSRSSLLAAIAAGLLGGCAGAPPNGADAGAADVAVYRMSQLSDQRWEVVRHVWVDSWQTAFYAPTFPTQDAAIAALKTEAARAGANGLVNVVCLDQGRPKWSSSTEPAVLCYGNAVRIRKGEG